MRVIAMSDRPRCDSCPFWSRDHETTDGMILGHCHHGDGAVQFNMDGQYFSRASFWCDQHPDAPKPVYEVLITSNANGPLESEGDDWEPVGIGSEATVDSVLWRRVVGHTSSQNAERPDVVASTPTTKSTHSSAVTPDG